jgi:ribosomal protein S18 acetylase RimI-like enzyme
MPSSLAHQLPPQAIVRPGEPRDLDALLALERRVFDIDQISRQSMRRMLASPSTAVIVVEREVHLDGAAVVLFRSRSRLARLYSIAVAPELKGQGVGAMLLQAAEACAAARGCTSLRLEVHVANAAAIARYRKSGYRQFGRLGAYYEDGGDALRFEKSFGGTAGTGRDTKAS